MPVYFIKPLSFILWTRECLDSVTYRREYAPFRIEIGKDIDNSRVDLQLNRMNGQRFKCLLLCTVAL